MACTSGRHGYLVMDHYRCGLGKSERNRKIREVKPTVQRRQGYQRCCYTTSSLNRGVISIGLDDAINIKFRPRGVRPDAHFAASRGKPGGPIGVIHPEQPVARRIAIGKSNSMGSIVKVSQVQVAPGPGPTIQLKLDLDR